jgi:5-methylcytosine-specific restriction protein B
MFTWIPIHKETIQKILKQPVSQNDLLQILRDMEQQGLKVISLQDKDTQGQAIPMAEIDPFTFLASFNRGVSPENRRENWSFLKARWGLQSPVPEDFTGIPTLNNMRSWLFPYAADRTKNHMENLWLLASQADGGGIEQVDESLFDRCLHLDCVGIGILTICIFWINPQEFLPADSKTTAYAKAKGIAIKPREYQSYRQWLKEMTEQLGNNYPQVSHAAHLFAGQGKSWSFTKWMGPLLDTLRALGGSGSPKDVAERIRQECELPDSVITETMKSGQSRFQNEVAWARKYLCWEGLVESTKRGVWTLTQTGTQTVLDETQAQVIAKKWAAVHKQSTEEGPEDDVAQSQDKEPEAKDGGPYKTLLESVPHRYWTFAPGRDGEYWPEFYENRIMATGWDNTDDLRQFKNKEEIRQKLLELEPEGSSKTHDSLALWQFAHEIQTGDIIFAKQGFTKLLGYGVVEGDYYYDTQRTYYKHVRKMKWLAKGEWEMPVDSKMAPKTLTDITTYPDVVRLIASKVGLDMGTEPKPVVATPSAVTGVAYWWLNANPKIWSFEETPVGQQQTYTSHNEKGNRRQKYKYFQEVKPGDLVVGYVTSPQKEVVSVCKITMGLHPTEKGEQIEFKTVEQLTKPIAYATLQSNPDLACSEPLINNQGSLFKLTEQEYEIIRSLIDETDIPSLAEVEPYDKKMAMRGLFLAETQFDEMLAALNEKKNVVLQGAPGVGKTYVAKRLAYAIIGSNDPQRIEMIQFHQSYSYEDFIQGFRPTPKGHFDLKYGIFYQFCRQAQREEARGKPYVFIIDEINRGNLSKIFGELMMLIEPDKRGKVHAIPLAYSQDPDERFYIPENVYLIGTMNTADRSLAMVDYALRRRFRFVTLRPEFASEAFRAFLADVGAKPELVRKIVARMVALNETIAEDTKNLGPGYQIGHSYFCPRNGITPDDDWYRRVIESEIVPLIQEYWFDNEQRVQEQKSALLESA